MASGFWLLAFSFGLWLLPFGFSFELWLLALAFGFGLWFWLLALGWLLLLAFGRLPWIFLGLSLALLGFLGSDCLFKAEKYTKTIPQLGPELFQIHPWMAPKSSPKWFQNVS